MRPSFRWLEYITTSLWGSSPQDDDYSVMKKLRILATLCKYVKTVFVYGEVEAKLSMGAKWNTVCLAKSVLRLVLVVMSAWFRSLAEMTSQQDQTYRRSQFKYHTKNTIFPYSGILMYQFVHIPVDGFDKVSYRTTESYWIELFTSSTYFHSLLV